MTITDKPAEWPPAFGYLYAIVNPAWPGLVKIGHTTNVKSRFWSYQTGDPHRAYRIVGWSDVTASPDKVEKVAHEHFATARVAANGEWFKVTEAQALAYLNTLRAQPLSSQAGVAHTAEAEAEWYGQDIDADAA